MGLAWLCLLLPVLASAQVSVLTYHNDLARTGENLNETILSPTNVNPSQFGQLFSHAVDGQVYAQPLYMPRVAIPGNGFHNVVFIATEHDSVYAFDADTSAGQNAQPLWRVNFINPSAGITTVGVDDAYGCTQIQPEIGITGTPVIDPTTNTLYVVAMTKENGAFFQRLHALNVTTGAERPGSPLAIQASVPGTGDGGGTNTVTFVPQHYKSRPGLLLLNGVVYTSWSSHCDAGAYHGWVIGYDAKTLRQVSVFNDTPNGFMGSYWQSGAAPAADSDGNIFLVAGNGKFDADAGGNDYGETFLKLSTKNGLAAADYFAPFNFQQLNDGDVDIGSSGAILLPDSVGSAAHPHLLTSAGKEGRIYLLDRDNLGHFREGSDSQIVQSLTGAIGALFGSPAYFNNTVYFSGVGDALKAFPIAAGRLAESPSSQSPETFPYPGSVPSISANGSSNGIVWTIDASNGGTLRAYDASNLAHELYNTNTNPARDALGSYVKFSTPTIVNGKVYVGTANTLAVYGLLGQSVPGPAAVVNAASFQAGPVAPGSLVSVFGTNLATATMSVNGVPAPLLYSGPNQINTQVPFEISDGSATAQLQTAGGSASISFPVAAAGPGIFTNSGHQAAPGDPVKAGSFLAVYLTGQGALSIPVATGAPAPADPLARAAYPVTATLGGQPATVVFAGLSPGSVGLFQVNLKVPSLPPGLYPLVISVNGVSSNTAQVTVSGN